MLTGAKASKRRAFLSAYTYDINGAITKPLGLIRLHWWWRKKPGHMRLHSLHRLAGEGLLDEATQGEIVNHLVGEFDQSHCLQDLHGESLNKKLDDRFDLSWINRT